MLANQKPQTKTALHNALVKAYKATLPSKPGDDADRFANAFASALDEVITNEIEKMIKAQSISIKHNVNPTSDQLIISTPAGSGSITGNLNIDPFDVKIN